MHIDELLTLKLETCCSLPLSLVEKVLEDKQGYRVILYGYKQRCIQFIEDEYEIPFELRGLINKTDGFIRIIDEPPSKLLSQVFYYYNSYGEFIGALQFDSR